MPVSSDFDIQAALGEYESNVGKRTGRLAVTVDRGQVSTLGVTARCMKIFLVGLALFLLIAGIIVLATGQYASNSSDAIEAVGTALISAVYCMGAFLVIVGFAGLVGARTETRFCLLIFTGLLGALFIALLIIGAWSVAQVQEGKVYNLVYSYYSNVGVDTRRAIMLDYQCCGPNVPCQGVAINDCPMDPSLLCRQNNTCTCADVLPPANIQSCVPLITSDVEKSYTAFGAVGIAISIICLGGILGACCLMSGIKISKEKQAEIKRKEKRRAQGLDENDDL